ncbi:MAG: efflux RND transporter periplasmic adaptor subunit [Thiotrichaceae bacterium]
MIKKRTFVKPIAYLFPPLLSLCLLPFSTVNAAEIVDVASKESSAQTILGSTVIPYKEVTLSAQVPGRIVSINGDVGTMISAGNLIVKIDDDDLQARRRAALAGMDSAQAALNNAQTQYRREVTSPKSKNISGMPGMGMPAMVDIFMTRPMYEMMGDYDEDTNRRADLTNSSTAVTQAKSQLMQAQAQLNGVDAKLKDSYAVAPFAGMVLEKMVEVGDTVQPGQPLIKFGDVKFKRLQAAVPSMMVGNLVKGMVVPVTINGTLRTDAKVAQIYPIADPTRHTVTVKFDLRTGINAAPGMYAEISIPNSSQGKKNVLVIPNSALLKGRSLDSVLRIGADGKSELRLVRLGAEQSDGTVAVESGLQAGDKVINHPPASATSGWMPAQ